MVFVPEPATPDEIERLFDLVSPGRGLAVIAAPRAATALPSAMPSRKAASITEKAYVEGPTTSTSARVQATSSIIEARS